MSEHNNSKLTDRGAVYSAEVLAHAINQHAQALFTLSAVLKETVEALRVFAARITSDK